MMTEQERVITKIVDLALAGAEFYLDGFEEVGWLRAYPQNTDEAAILLFEWELCNFPSGNQLQVTTEQAIDGIKKLWPVRLWSC
jgi:hypothetical protein